MRALNGADVFHLRREDDGQPSHTIKVAILAPGDGPLDADDAAAWAASTLPNRAPFRWRLQPIPLGLGRPVWVDADTVDPAHHIRRHTLAGSDPDAALADLVSTLAGDRLDRDRPLWRLWVVDGLDGGRVALVAAVAPRPGRRRRQRADLGGGPRRAVRRPPPGDTAPGGPALVRATVARHLRSWRDLPSFLRRLRAAAADRKRRPAGSPTATDVLRSAADGVQRPADTGPHLHLRHAGSRRSPVGRSAPRGNGERRVRGRVRRCGPGLPPRAGRAPGRVADGDHPGRRWSVWMTTATGTR